MSASDITNGVSRFDISIGSDNRSDSSDVGNLISSSVPQEGHAPESLEGVLSVRGKTTSTRGWLRCYVVLRLTDGGLISCYINKTLTQGMQGNGASMEEQSLPPDHSMLYHSKSAYCSFLEKERESNPPYLCMPETVPWIAKDIANDEHGFVIEVPQNSSIETLSPLSDTSGGKRFDWTKNKNDDNSNLKPLRVYFKCSRKGNEKALWLDAFQSLSRLSHELRHKKGIMALLMSPPSVHMSHSRVRSMTSETFAREGRMQEQRGLDSQRSVFSEGDLMLKDRKVRGSKEYLVYPMYAYPNRWMTNAELHKEMLKPSAVYHDLRKAHSKQKEIGVLKVEVLQCLGLPRLDRASETDGVVYLVCGSAAFATDVIWNRLNPIWLPKSRRACVFPIYHAYACLYVGVFDDDGKKEKDDFAGRVVINLSCLRPRSVYDVTLPLRLSSHVYARRPRGAIRLRFSLEWKSEREALLSYLPRKIRPPSTQRPDDDVTVLCADEKAFRNIATTVHGIHMPGRFSFQQWRSTLREANFTRKVIVLTLRQQAVALVLWKNPQTSLCVFSVWMRCVYLNTFSVVPAYLALCALLLMVRNYVLFGTDGPVQNGFVPPSFEEMFHALAKGGDSQAIAPIEMKPPRRSLSTSLADFYDPKPSTHVPKGKKFFGLLGFHDDDPASSPEDYHMEFAWSRGLNYHRFTVRESLVEKQPIIARTKKKGQDREEIDAAAFDEGEYGGSRQLIDISLKRMIGNNEGDNGGAGDLNPYDALEETGNDIVVKSSSTDMDIDPSNIIPEQNIDIETKKTKKLSEDLADIETNVHKLTFHLFNDRTHVLRANSRYFGEAKKGEMWRRANVAQELDRLLNVGQYSSANPVVARVGMFIMPMISAAHSGLCLSRALYNIATWRDPFLSFWVSLLLLVIVVIMFVFPWRFFFLLLGIGLVGPQNWIARILHEHGKLPKKLEEIFQTRERDKSGGKQLEDATELPLDQPIVSSHTSDGSPPLELSHDDVDPREVHAVSVPYSQLMYRRLYDWPPEPQYAKIQQVDHTHLNGLGKNFRNQPLSSLSQHSGQVIRRARNEGDLLSQSLH